MAACTPVMLVAAAFLCVLTAPIHATIVRSTGRLRGDVLPENTSRLLPTGANVSVPSAHFSAQPVMVPVDAPTMFVAVMTTRSTPIDKRMAIRALWNEVDGGQGHICARFVVCQGADAYQQSLLAEHTAYGDLLFLGCAEGYAQGLLTKKVIAAMRAHRQAAGGKDPCLDRPLFMKMDDDTFVSGHRFRQGLSSAVAQFGADNIYAGVDLPSQPPQRNPASHWYEPPQIWPHQNYPPAMYGGPGYILGRGMVHRIIDDGIADAHVLWNEDRAVGVWVNILEQKLIQVAWIRIPGTNGFFWDKPVKSGVWGMYPYTLAHHLSKACIACLTAIDKANDPNAHVDQCFLLEPLQG